MFNLPQVTERNTLIFDSNGPVPEEIPLFTKVGPNEFEPIFEDCPHRTLKTVKLSPVPTCKRMREIWWCVAFDTDVYPKTCAECTHAGTASKGSS